MRICITIGGKVHCFTIPLLFRPDVVHIPHPTNYPELELAASVLYLVRALQPVIEGSTFAQQLAEVSSRFVQQVQSGMPKGVELHQGEHAGS